MHTSIAISSVVNKGINRVVPSAYTEVREVSGVTAPVYWLADRVWTS